MTEKGTMTELSTNHSHSVAFTKHPDHYISYMSYERLHREEHFHIKKGFGESLVFMINALENSATNT